MSMSWKQRYNTDPIYKLAIDSSRAGDHDQSVQALLQLAEREPAEAHIQWKLGFEYLELKQVQAAIDHFQQSLRLDSDCEPAWGGLGTALKEQGLLEESERAFRRAVALKPRCENWVLLADVLNQRQHYQEAIDACEQALQLDPVYEEAFLNLGIALNALGRQAEAIEVLGRATTLDPAYAEAYYVLGMIHYGGAEYKLAESCLLEALRNQPTHIWAQLYLALTVWQDGRHSEAEVAFQTAMKLQPHPLISRYYAQFCRETGWISDADQTTT